MRNGTNRKFFEQPRTNSGTFSSSTYLKPENTFNVGRQESLGSNRRVGSRDISGSTFSYESSGKKFVGIDELCNDIRRNYIDSEVGNIYDGKYRVVSVGEGTPESLIERLTAPKKTKLIYLIAEEINE